jgi:hypothetical protein
VFVISNLLVFSKKSIKTVKNLWNKIFFTQGVDSMKIVDFIEKFMKADEDTKKKIEEILSASVAENESPLENPCKNPIQH